MHPYVHLSYPRPYVLIYVEPEPSALRISLMNWHHQKTSANYKKAINHQLSFMTLYLTLHVSADLLGSLIVLSADVTPKTRLPLVPSLESFRPSHWGGGGVSGRVTCGGDIPGRLLRFHTGLMAALGDEMK